MSGAELLCLNLTETRRRSIRIWRAIPLALEADYLYGQMLRERRSHSGDSPFGDRHFDDLNAAPAFANPYRESLLETVLVVGRRSEIPSQSVAAILATSARLVTSSCESHFTKQFTPDRCCSICVWLVFHGHQSGI